MKRLIAGALSLAALATAVAFAQSPAPKPAQVKATVDSGVLIGETQDGVNVFRGVPFAKPPIGALRWKAPAKPDKTVSLCIRRIFLALCFMTVFPTVTCPSHPIVT